MTGYDLLRWLRAQNPNDLRKPVGVVGHFNEFYEIRLEPEVMTARTDWDDPTPIEVIKLETVDIGPSPD
jgi:hypothetical protein